jgi:hypothetical protein
VHDAGDRADLFLHLLRGTLDPPGVEPVEQSQRREEQQLQQHHPDVDQRQAQQGEEDEGEDADGERHRTHHLGGGQHIAVGVGQQLAGRVRAVEVEGYVEVGVGDAAPPRCLDAERGDATVVATQHDRNGLEQAHRQQGQ